MTRSDRWTDRVLAFLAGVVLTALVGGLAVPAVHHGMPDARAETGDVTRVTCVGMEGDTLWSRRVVNLSLTTGFTCDGFIGFRPAHSISREASVREYRQRAYVALDSAREARDRFAACRDSLYAVGVVRVPGLGP